MLNHDGQDNAPRAPVPGVPTSLRGRWIVPLAIVSAITGMMMFVGGAAGGGIARAVGFTDIEVLAPAFLGILAGGVAGVWIGSMVAIRLTGGDPKGRLLVTGICGTVGLVVGLGLLILAAQVSLVLIAGLGLIAPGIGAALGDRIALQRKMRAGS